MRARALVALSVYPCVLRAFSVAPCCCFFLPTSPTQLTSNTTRCGLILFSRPAQDQARFLLEALLAAQPWCGARDRGEGRQGRRQVRRIQPEEQGSELACR